MWIRENHGRECDAAEGKSEEKGDIVVSQIDVDKVLSETSKLDDLVVTIWRTMSEA